MPAPRRRKTKPPQAPPTFLAFVWHEEFGSVGSSHCPKCDPDASKEWKSISIRPPLGNFPIKFRCHRCGWWGDEHDVLRHVYPGDANKDIRRLRLAELKRMYLRDYGHHPRTPLGERVEKLAGIVRPTGKRGSR
jgi:hypothetical protein